LFQAHGQDFSKSRIIGERHFARFE
jgi:hypothetical protein